jgi:hypothetical protein
MWMSPGSSIRVVVPPKGASGWISAYILNEWLVDATEMTSFIPQIENFEFKTTAFREIV